VTPRELLTLAAETRTKAFALARARREVVKIEAARAAGEVSERTRGADLQAIELARQGYRIARADFVTLARGISEARTLLVPGDWTDGAPCAPCGCLLLPLLCGRCELKIVEVTGCDHAPPPRCPDCGAAGEGAR